MLQQQKSSNFVNSKDSSTLRIIKQRASQKQALIVLNDKEEIGGSSAVSRNDLSVTMKSPQPPTLPRQENTIGTARSPKKLQDSFNNAPDDSHLSSARLSSAMTAPSSSQYRHIHVTARESYDYSSSLPDVNPQKASPIDFIPTDVGLENLGNTCFMNSTLQCLLHIEPLVRYFLHSDIESQLNLASPKKGHLASSFRQLVEEVYRGRVGTTTAATATAAVVVVSPSHLQRAVSTYAPYLMDYQQQDSQEFLRFLLDGISEDLCRKHSQDSTDNSNSCDNPKSARTAGNRANNAPATNNSVSSNTESLGRSRSSTIASLSILPALVPSQSSPPAGGCSSPSPSTPSSSSSQSPALLLLSSQNLAGAKPVLSSRFVDGLSDDDNSVTAQCSASAGTSPVISTPSSSSSTAYRSSAVSRLREEARHSRSAAAIEWTSTKRSSNQSYDDDGLSGSVGSPLDSNNNNNKTTSAAVFKHRNRSRLISGPYKDSQKSDSDSEGGGSNEEESSIRSAARMNSSSSNNSSSSSSYRSSTARGRSSAYGQVPTQQPSDHPTADLSIAAEKEARQAWAKYLQLNDSIITDLFAGQLQSTIKCLTCNHRSSSYDPFLDLSVPIHKGESEPPKTLIGSLKSSLGSGSVETNKSTLEKCLGIFTAEEVLDGDNMYMCEKCKKKQRSVKQLTVYKYPRVLVIHIKRFRFNSMRREKLSTDVHFPLSGLDLSPFLSPDIKLSGVPGKDWRRPTDSRPSQPTSPPPPPPPVYDLIGVSNHHGSLHSGHYIAHVDITGGRVDLTPKWMCFNDARVSIASASSVCGPTAYVLFYKLKEQQQQPS